MYDRSDITKIKASPFSRTNWTRHNYHFLITCWYYLCPINCWECIKTPKQLVFVIQTIYAAIAHRSHNTCTFLCLDQCRIVIRLRYHIILIYNQILVLTCAMRWFIHQCIISQTCFTSYTSVTICASICISPKYGILVISIMCILLCLSNKKC